MLCLYIVNCYVATNIPGIYFLLPDICLTKKLLDLGHKNVIIPFCKIHNDSSCSISQDGSLIAVFVPSVHGFPMDAQLKVISLKPENYLQCIYSRKYGKKMSCLCFGFIHLVRSQISRETNISYPLMRTRTFTCQGLINASFPKYFANVLNELWLQILLPGNQITIQMPAKHIWWVCTSKIVNGFQLLIIFAKLSFPYV